MNDLALLLIGAVIGAVSGVAIKAYIDPILQRRHRSELRRETELERSVEYAKDVLAAMQSVRHEVTTSRNFDSDAIALDIILALSPDAGPGPMTDAANIEGDDELETYAGNALNAWAFMRIVQMDAEHGVDLSSDPVELVQLFESSLNNYVYSANRRLGLVDRSSR